MSDSAKNIVERQITQVRRRLFAHVLVESVLFCWGVGLLCAMAWFLARPFAFSDAGDGVHFGVPGAVLGVATIAGLVLAWIRCPSRLLASLELDQRFGLKERVTTFLTLSDEHLASPAGQALLQDVSNHLAKVRVANEIPLLRVRWQRAVLPALGLLLAATAFLLEPWLGDLRVTPRTNAEEKQVVVNVEEMQKQLDQLKKKVVDRSQEKLAKSDDLQALEKEFEKLLNQPLDKKDETKIRERINEMRNLEDKLKQRLDGVREKTEKTDALKKQLERLGFNKDEQLKEGAAKDFEDALKNGDFNKAKAALEKIVKDLKNDKLDAKEQKKLAEQFQKIQDKLDKLLKNDEFRNKLKKDLADKKITKDEFNRQADQFQELEDLKNMAGDIKDALDKNDGKGGAEKLEKLMKQLEQAEQADKELTDLLRDQEEVAEAMRILMEGQGEGENDGDDNGMGLRPGGKRAIDPNDPNSKITPSRTRAEVNQKGKQKIVGYARGSNFQKVPAKAVEGVFRQAAQEGADAIERQRIPDDAADIARGYFDKLGNQK